MACWSTSTPVPTIDQLVLTAALDSQLNEKQHHQQQQSAFDSNSLKSILHHLNINKLHHFLQSSLFTLSSLEQQSDKLHRAVDYLLCDISLQRSVSVKLDEERRQLDVKIGDKDVSQYIRKSYSKLSQKQYSSSNLHCDPVHNNNIFTIHPCPSLSIDFNITSHPSRQLPSASIHLDTLHTNVPSATAIHKFGCALTEMAVSDAHFIQQLNECLPTLMRKMGRLFVLNRCHSYNDSHRFIFYAPTTEHALLEHYFTRHITLLSVQILNEQHTDRVTELKFGRANRALEIKMMKHRRVIQLLNATLKPQTVAEQHQHCAEHSASHSVSQVSYSALSFSTAMPSVEEQQGKGYIVTISGCVKLFGLFDVQTPRILLRLTASSTPNTKTVTLRLHSIQPTRSMKSLLALFGMNKLLPMLQKTLQCNLRLIENASSGQTDFDVNVQCSVPGSHRAVAVLKRIGLSSIVLRILKSWRKIVEAAFTDIDNWQREGY